MLRRVLSTVLKQTDHSRWARPGSLESWWEPRTALLAAMLPSGSRVLEFGAGNGQLARYLDSSCTYTPSDLVDRGPGTLVCDLNARPLPQLPAGTFDVAVMLGVLEYLRDVPGLLDWLAERVPTCAVSYVCAEAKPWSLAEAREWLDRRRMGWMNSYRDDALVALFRDRGFEQQSDATWKNNRLFVFTRQ